MKHLLLTTIAAVVLVGCGESVDIHEAVSKGNIEAVKQHIAAGTDVNARNELGITPLLLATGMGHKEIAELLIAKGADLNAKSGIWTPLHIAAKNGHKEIAELLIAKGADVNAKNKNGHTPLDIAINMKKTETADILRKHGGKYSAIHFAVGNGDVEAVKEFLGAGTDVNAKTDWGDETPLDLAIRFKHTETAALLRKHGGKTKKELEAAGK